LHTLRLNSFTWFFLLFRRKILLLLFPCHLLRRFQWTIFGMEMYLMRRDFRSSDIIESSGGESRENEKEATSFRLDITPRLTNNACEQPLLTKPI
jgi:hypothetical protein